MAATGSQTNWSQVPILGIWTTNSSTKIMTWAMGPSLVVFGPRGGLPTQFDTGHGEICTSFLPEGMYQQGDFHFKRLPCGPFPFPPTCCLTYPLQCAGVGHKPVWLPHTLCHFFLSHELSNVEDSWGRWANVLPSNLDTPPPHHEEALGQ